jgi:hypothetical protein
MAKEDFLAGKLIELLEKFENPRAPRPVEPPKPGPEPPLEPDRRWEETRRWEKQPQPRSWQDYFYSLSALACLLLIVYIALYWNRRIELRPTNGQTSDKQTIRSPGRGTDTFSADSGLSTSLWSVNTKILRLIAANTSFLVSSTYEQPVLAFNGSGMSMSGVNGNYQFTGIQSNASFTPPFTVQTTVEGTVDHGIAFEPYVISGDLSQYVSLSANLAPNSGYYGMNVNTGALSNDGFGGTTIYHGTVNTWYTVTFKFDGSGNAQVTLTDGSGNQLGSTTPFHVGNGPFYVVLAQREGLPNFSGPNKAIWQSVSVTSP